MPKAVFQNLKQLSLDIRKIDRDLFAQVAAEALQHPRLRLNHNFHREQDSVQRFLNVLQPGTYVRPHRHRRDGSGTGFECFLVLQGAIGLLLFNSEGEIQKQLHLSAKGHTYGIESAEDQFHTLVALEADSVDFLYGFPQEGTTEAARQESQWRDLLSGSGLT